MLAEVESLQKSLTQLNHQLSNNSNTLSGLTNIEAQQDVINGLCHIIYSSNLKSAQNLKPPQLKIS